MRFGAIRRVVIRHPSMVVLAWCLLAVFVATMAPDLTKLAAEGQANLLPSNSESARMARAVAKSWPDQSYESMAVAVLHRPEGLTEQDKAYGSKLAQAFEAGGRPKSILRIMGPHANPDVAKRLISGDGTLQLVAVPLSISFVSPAAHDAVDWLREQMESVKASRPAGLEVSWTGDAVIGGDYMDDVQKSLDRAAVATVVLLLVVLFFVYRSILLALVPLVTIGISLTIARGMLAWLATQGWAVSPLVELFLVVVLFGSGTDFCLFLAWRFGEHWDECDLRGAMNATLRGVIGALLTSAGTVIAGLSLMGTTRFKLFSSTGPSVALGLALTVSATLTLTPALLLLLARYRPKAFHALVRPDSSFWHKVGNRVLKRPLTTWVLTLLLMTPAAILGLKTQYTQDLFTEMPASTESVKSLRVVSDKFGSGFLSPLTVVISAHPKATDANFRESRGLALIDDASRFLSHNRKLVEVRSATQPLGSTDLLNPARIGSRLGAVNEGFSKMVDGADQLHDGLVKGVQKFKTGLIFESFLGRNLPGGFFSTQPQAKAAAPPTTASSNPLSSVVKWTDSALSSTRQRLDKLAPKEPEKAGKEGDRRQVVLNELARAADGAGQIAAGSRRALHEISAILSDPVGRHALDRLLITPETVREHPDLKKSFDAYISPDGRVSRIDVIPGERMNSEAAMNQVLTLRRRLSEYLEESPWLRVEAGIAGANAESADIRSLTRRDQQQTWLIVPAGVFLILLLALRDPWACINLVATMLLTYAFALGITHLVFVTGLGDEGLDWKVPYFLFVLLVAVGVDYNVFLMSRLQEETRGLGLRKGITQAIASTGGLISSAAAITACSFASFMLSPLGSIRQLGFALVVGIAIDAILVRPVLVPCGHWLMKRRTDQDTNALSEAAPMEELSLAAK
ncbi:MMPL family transporter [Singulisphaera sp. PoT]|uniref:MMPL family transporter n=1 Tax=Singulisphaera sp. PoT TaxID=3411797 RepID=UPI003BF4D06B